MGAAPPSPHVTLRAMSGTFLIIRVIDAPPALSRFAFAHRNFSPGQMMFTARLREALHEPASLSAIRRFYTDQRLIVDNKSDLQIMQDFVHELDIGRLAVFYFPDLHGTGRPLSGPQADEAIAPATGAVSGWSMRQKLAEMFRRLPRFVPDAVRGEIVAFLSEENIRNMVAFFIVFALVQTIPGADAAADAVLTALAWYYYGWGGAVAAYKLIAAVVTAATAKSEADIDHAARDAAQALVALGTVFLLKKLNDRMRQRGGQDEGGKPGGGEESAGGGQGGKRPQETPVRRIPDPDQYVKTRVNELNNQIPANSRGRITMAVGVVEDQSGAQSVLVGTSEPRGYLRPGVTLDPGETMVAGTGHAEADIVNYAAQNNLSVVSIGATRPVCAGCQSIIPDATSIATPLKP